MFWLQGDETVTYLGFSMIAAFATALTMYAETGSFLYAFLAYSVTGTVVLLAALASAAHEMRAEDNENAEDRFLI